MIILRITPSHASILSPLDPATEPNFAIDHNPARAAYLKDQNQFQISTMVYNENDYNEPVYAATNGLVDGALTLDNGRSYWQASYQSYTLGNNFKRGVDDTLPRDASNRLWSTSSYVRSCPALGISWPMFNNILCFGIEAAQETSSFKRKYSATLGSTVTGDSLAINEFLHYRYSIGILWPIFKPLTLSMTYTLAEERSFEWQHITDYPGAGRVKTTETIYGTTPACAGLGLLWTIAPWLETGLGAEFFSGSLAWDMDDQNHMLTKPFTKAIAAIGWRLNRSSKLTLSGSVIQNKDARTNYYDWELLKTKQTYSLADDAGELDVQNVFNEEDFGIGYEFSMTDFFSMTIGLHQKNYIFEGRSNAQAIGLAVHDTRAFIGFSIPGILEPEPVAPALPTQAVAATTSGQIKKAGTTFIYQTPSGDAIPLTLVKAQERVNVSSTTVIPGTDIVISIKEGGQPLEGAAARFISGKEVYDYPFYRDDSGRLKCTVPIPPRMKPGKYTIELQKLYEGQPTEKVTFNVTVRKP